jgi:hypothetical protein
LSWIPHAGGQTEFLARGEFEALYGGRAGPGKTDCLIAAPTRWIVYPDFKGLLLRRTFPQLQEIIDRCYQRYPGLGGVYRSTEHRWYFPSGGTIQLGHMQHETDKYNYQGKEYNFIGPDELTQFLESQILYLFSRLRSTNPAIPTQFRATTNPGGIGHKWVKDRYVTMTEPGKTYIDPKTGLSRVFIPGQREDNPSLFENDPGYLSRLDALPEIERLRLKDGIWDSFEGQIFTELSQRVHGIEPFDIPPEWERFCVLDWGFAKPFSVGWYAVDYDGILYRYREWYGTKPDTEDTGIKMLAYEVANGILDRERGEKIRMRIADPSIWHPRPPSRKGESRGQTIKEDFDGQGVYFVKADNDRAQGKQQVHKRLRIEEDIDSSTGEIESEHAMFRCFNSCEHFWRTMLEVREDPKNPEDVDTDQEDHVYDEFRYMCMARPIAPSKVVRIPKGSFQYERNRLIKAKEYAKRHGVSLAVAYQRIR